LGRARSPGGGVVAPFQHAEETKAGGLANCTIRGDLRAAARKLSGQRLDNLLPARELVVADRPFQPGAWCKAVRVLGQGRPSAFLRRCGWPRVPAPGTQSLCFMRSPY